MRSCGEHFAWFRGRLKMKKIAGCRSCLAAFFAGLKNNFDGCNSVILVLNQIDFEAHAGKAGRNHAGVLILLG
jgi:hypothetical protein